MTDEQLRLIAKYAHAHRVPVAHAIAVFEVESGGTIANPDGTPTIRLEAHKLFTYAGKDAPSIFDTHFRPRTGWRGQQFRQNACETWRAIHVDRQDREHEAFALARALFPGDGPYLSISVGPGQIMGFHFSMLGYVSARAMVEAFHDLPTAIAAVFEFIVKKNALDALREADWRTFARIYNGSNVDDYAARLARACAEARRSGLHLVQVSDVPPGTAVWPNGKPEGRG
ncbi:N-acetylmuramidase family protein [bacterium]|nr:N-acetylmuramidase family protein [bacterium]